MTPKVSYTEFTRNPVFCQKNKPLEIGQCWLAVGGIGSKNSRSFNKLRNLDLDQLGLFVKEREIHT